MLKTTRFDEVTRIDSARTIDGRGRYWTTAYLVGGLMIDTGCAHTAGELVKQFERDEISNVVNTHSHEDHIGANGILRQRDPGLKIFAHPLAVPVLKNPADAQPLEFYRRVMWGWPQPSVAAPVSDGDTLETENHSFEIIYTPGHSPDHLCVYEQNNGWLFTGDLFVGGRDRALRTGYRIWEIIASLKLVSSLPLTRLYPGSARVRENPAQEIADKIDYLEETGEKVLQLKRKGWSSGRIARALFGGPMLIEAFTGGHFTRRALVRSFISRDHE